MSQVKILKLKTDSLDARYSLPSQTGNSGKYLTTDGTDASWGTVSASGVSIAQATGNLSSASFANTNADLVWNAFSFNNTTCSLSGAEITINDDGIYKFTVTLRTDSNNRTELIIHTYIDTGSGYAEDTAAITSDYVSRDTDQNTGAVTLIYAFDLNDGDKIKFNGEGDTDGTCVGLDAGTVLVIEQY